ncbi:MAG: right-handed parallel beta-helix repeat-containing protein [Clostridia bacterium]|nr:right-handed parallel beta-helix repeat-containing protein [Clostridia bacterium]
MSVYYIDSLLGREEFDGLTPETPKNNWLGLALLHGDTVLLCRGRRYTNAIVSPDGAPGDPIVWGAYGEGTAPQLTACAVLNDPAGWEETAENIWRWNRVLPTEPGNVIFNGGESFGALRWELEDLREPGDWFDTGFGKRWRKGETGRTEEHLYLFSRENPALVWKNIECALHGERSLATARRHVVIRDLAFYGSGVHGFATADAEDIRIENCSFRCIGGLVWSKELRIRFGNGVEFWNTAKDIVVTGCTFKDVYDSCFTHQGSLPYPAPQNIVFENCTCDTYGMAAYEIRDIVPLATVFANNTCINAGCGFAMLGEELPRRSEIWPQPMGHHLFIWRIEKATPGGSIEVKNNTFGPASNGSAVYSIVSPAAEEQMHFTGNTYTHPDANTIRWGGEYLPLADFELDSNA